MNERRLLQLMRAAIERCHLDLRGATVLTEAASGAYVVTPVLAAMAGAERVYAVTRDSRYGTVADVTSATMSLAAAAECADRLQVITQATPRIMGEADIVTNSGHVRPIDGSFVRRMKPTAVIPLMYEAWEFRDGDVDLRACRECGIRVVGTNERHPAVDVFSYLGMMAVKLLLDAGVAVYLSHVAVLCDNLFAPYIRRGLEAAGAETQVVARLDELDGDSPLDAVVVALTPRSHSVFNERDVVALATRWPGAVVAQYWGDLDRRALTERDVACWPVAEPPAGHMGVLPSALGPEPVVRLQSGGLKSAEVVWRQPSAAGQRPHQAAFTGDGAEFCTSVNL